MAKTLLKVQNFSKFYKTRDGYFKAVNDVSFEVKAGEVLAIVGETGSGKSTLGEALMRLTPGSTGFVQLDNEIVSGHKLDDTSKRFLRKNMQMVFKDPYGSLNTRRTVYSILGSPLKISRVVQDEMNILLKDWDKVKQTNKLTFEIFKTKTSLKFQEIFFNEITSRYSIIMSGLSEHNVAHHANVDDAFSELMSIFFMNKFSANAHISQEFNKLVVEQYRFYMKKSKDYENNALLPNEIKFRDAAKDLARAKKLVKASMISYDKREENIRLRAKLAEDEERIKHNERVAGSIFKSLLKELNVYAKEQLGLMKDSKTFEEYNGHIIKNTILVQIYKTLKKDTSTSLSGLQKNRIAEIWTMINDIVTEIMIEHQSWLSTPTRIEFFTLKKIGVQAAHTIDQKIEIYIQLAKDNSLFYKDETLRLSRLIFENKQLAKRTGQPDMSREDLREAHANYRQAFDDNNEAYLKAEQEARDELTLINIEIDKIANKGQKASQLHSALSNELFNSQFNEIVEWANKDAKDYRIMTRIANEMREKEDKEIDYINSQLKILARKKDLAKTPPQKNAFQRQETSKHEELKKIGDTIIAKRNVIRKKLLTMDNKWIAELVYEQQTHYTNELFEATYDDLLTKVERFKSKVKIARATNKAFEVDVHLVQKDIQATWVLMGLGDKNVSNIVIQKLVEKMTIFRTLEEVGLTREHAYRYPHELSRSQKQRVAIARALMTRPKIIIADEPVAHLDSSIQPRIVNLLKTLAVKNQMGIIFTAHNLSMVEYAANNINIMHLGRIVERGKTKTVFAKPIHPYVKRLITSTSRISNISTKFTPTNFKPAYLRDYSVVNFPMERKLSPAHFVLATTAQLGEWTGKTKAKRAKAAAAKKPTKKKVTKKKPVVLSKADEKKKAKLLKAKAKSKNVKAKSKNVKAKKK